MEEDDDWESGEEGPLEEWGEEEVFLGDFPLPFGYNPKPGGTWASRHFTKENREGKTMTDKLGQLMNVPQSSVLDASAAYQISQRFIAETAGDIYYGRIPLVVSDQKYSMKQIIDKLKEPLTEARAVMPYSEDCVIIRGDYGNSPMLIWININANRRTGYQHTLKIHDLNIQIISHSEAMEAMKKYIGRAFQEERLAEIKWWTQGDRNDNSREIYLPKSTTKLLPEFYPDLGDPTKYIADYMAADEAVLLIAGPPGTGKTTLIRHMIADHKLSAHVIYDEILMQKDRIFQSFLFDEHGDIMIIEDADTILNSREAEGNKLMSRFLNVSDGLIKLPNKKLVFTTNIVDFSKVDPALLRPGRCFGVMHTRALNLSEAQAAARVADLPIPTEKREYTIAELFNQGKKAHIRTIGFGARH